MLPGRRPSAPAKASDSRSASWRCGTCQLEALAPNTLAELVDAAIAEWFDRDKLDEQIRRERADRTELFRELPRGDVVSGRPTAAELLERRARC